MEITCRVYRPRWPRESHSTTDAGPSTDNGPNRGAGGEDARGDHFKDCDAGQRISDAVAEASTFVGLVIINVSTGRAQVDFDPRRAARYPGAERVVDFELDSARETPGGLPLRASSAEASPFNP